MVEDFPLSSQVYVVPRYGAEALGQDTVTSLSALVPSASIVMRTSPDLTGAETDHRRHPRWPG